MRKEKRFRKLLGMLGFLVFLSVMIGCEIDPPVNPGEEGTIYAAGYGVDSSSTYHAYYWVDGVLSELDNTIVTGGDAYAYAVYASGDDVYVSGTCENSNGGETPGYWKNGVWNSLSVNSAYSAYTAKAQGVYEYNGSVYLSGFYTKSSDWWDTVPGYWKDNEWHELPATIMNYGYAYSIVVDSAGIYVSGNITDSSSNSYAVYWKNDIPTYDTQKTSISTQNGGVTIAVEDSKVYVPGYSALSNRYLAGYMDESGNWTSLTELAGTIGSEARSVHVQDDHVYMTGYCYGSDAIPVYWKDGSPVALSTEAGYPIYAYEENGDIYAVGKKAAEFGMWKDAGGTGTNLSWISYEMPEDTLSFVTMYGAFYTP